MDNQYDVFISSNSKDYSIAEEIYDFLRKEGLHVFLACRELGRIGEAEYADAIDTALDGTMHMIVVASSISNLSSKWVHYEWSTFRSDKNSGYKSGNLITVLTDNVSMEELPAGLRHQQSFNYESYKTQGILDYFRRRNTIESNEDLIGNIEDDKYTENLVYEFNEKELTASVKSSEDVSNPKISIPPSIIHEGKKYVVIAIKKEAFFENAIIKTLKIPSSVKIIEEAAFFGCKNLENIVLNNGLEYIDYEAFAYCTKVQSINIPMSVKHIEYDAFVHCSGLQSITVHKKNRIYDSRENCNAIIDARYDTLITGCMTTNIPNTIVCIGSSAFEGCEKLKSIIFPDGLKSIERRAFEDCQSLKIINIPSTVTEIEGRDSKDINNEDVLDAFAFFPGCDGLTQINVASENNHFMSEDGVLFIKDMSRLLKYPPYKENTFYQIPYGTKEIYLEAFRGCNNLGNISFPTTISTISEYAFSECKGLLSVALPDSIISIGKFAFEECELLNSIKLPNKLKVIATDTFRGCRSLRTIDIPQGLEVIEQTAFSECESLTKIVLPYSIQTVESGAFDKCTNLKEVILQNKECIIEKNAFPLDCKIIFQSKWNMFFRK